jgi:bifunctional DNA-binding transcriptional regulator/antitoxin component of YhaV-PrlF toxin-antitoxin module
MVKVVVNRGQYKITIPKELAEERGLNSETRLKFVEDALGNIILKEIKIKKQKGEEENDK